MRCGFGCLLAVAVGEGGAMSSHLVISSSRHLVSSCGAALRFLLACGSSLVPLISPSYSSRLPAPLARVGERGAWASGAIVARRGLPRAGGGVACFVGDGQLMCRFCGCPFNRLIARVPSGIVFLVPYPRFVDRFFEWFFAINCLFPPPIRPVGVSPRSLLCFFLSLGATGAIFFIISL